MKLDFTTLDQSSDDEFEGLSDSPNHVSISFSINDEEPHERDFLNAGKGKLLVRQYDSNTSNKLVSNKLVSNKLVISDSQESSNDKNYNHKPITFLELNTDILTNILYYLSICDKNVRYKETCVGFTSAIYTITTCRYMMRLFYCSSSFWIGLAQEMYWSDLGTTGKNQKLPFLETIDRFKDEVLIHLNMRYSIKE
jgi:hypothetical protein